MIGEEKYYGAISADSPFFFENYQKLQDEEQTGWHAESQIPPSWSVVHSVPWTYAGTNERRLRVAGWKIHLSATPEKCGEDSFRCNSLLRTEGNSIQIFTFSESAFPSKLEVCQS